MTEEMKDQRNELLDALKNHILSVRFTKLNGEERIMQCTLSSNYTGLNLTSWGPYEESELITVWDINVRAWRSFYLNRVISASISS